MLKSFLRERLGFLGPYIPPTPRQSLGLAFDVIQLSRTLLDSKTLVDSIPRRSPRQIRNAFLNDYSQSVSLNRFVRENFVLPLAYTAPEAVQHDDPARVLPDYIEKMWDQLTRPPDAVTPFSSLLPLPHPYVVPGGRFRELYYWDSYFTMLGLREAGRTDLLRAMVANFAHLIETYGFIPNGTRSYYLTRSQPPCFALMVALLAEIDGDSAYVTYQAAMRSEHEYWMQGSRSKAFHSHTSDAEDHCVRMPDGEILNRFFDASAMPREEAFAEDVELARHVEDAEKFYRDMRAGAESGWDYSSRWFKDSKTRHTVRTTDLVPVDLNALLVLVENTIAHAASLSDDAAGAVTYRKYAAERARALRKYCFDDDKKWYFDFDTVSKQRSTEMTLAGAMPLFAGTASPDEARTMVPVLMDTFLRPGGLITTLVATGEQWDAPNGWAPLQHLSIVGLERYGFHKEAGEIAARWMHTIEVVFAKTGTLLEKYNVEHPDLIAGGGEYPVQDGFGWTNAGYAVLRGKGYRAR